MDTAASMKIKMNRYLSLLLLSHPLIQLLLLIIISLSLSSISWAQTLFQPARQISDNSINENIDDDFFQISRDGQRVVFLATQSLNSELFSVPINGGAVTQLNPNLVEGGNVTIDGAVSRPLSPFQISFDSQRVVYVADQISDQVFELFSVPIDGGAAVRLNADLVDGGDVAISGSAPEFQISPDGQRVIYIADQNQNNMFELFSVPIGGGVAPVRLNPNFSSTNSDIREFQISPDSQRVVYLADQNSDDTFELFSVSIAGGGLERLNSNLVALGDVDLFQISPDSQRVVYRADQNVFGDNELFSASITGGNVTRLNGVLAVSGGNSSDVELFQISPNSQRVVYRADQNINDTFELFSVSINGNNSPTRLNSNITNGGDVLSQFEISPNSQRVVYLADQNTNNDFELFSVLISGGLVTRLNSANTSIASTQFLSSLPSNAFDISPDGQRVIYLANFSGGTGQLFSTSVSGGNTVRIDSATPGNVPPDFQISPDSQRVLFSSESFPRDLFSVTITGANTEQIDDNSSSDLDIGNSQFSLDGRQIVFIANGSRLFSSSQGTAVTPTPGDGELCVPIRAQNGSIAVVCL